MLYVYGQTNNFGIFIELSPDEEQKAQLEQNVQMALSKGGIDLEDAIDIRELRNLKLANQLLKLKRSQKMEREQNQEAEKVAMQNQMQLKQQQMASEMAVQKFQMELQGKMQLKQSEVAFDIEKMKNEAQLKSQLMQQEFQLNMQIRGIDAQELEGRENKREGAKADRISQQNSEQSKLINQRKNNLPPISFESNEDSLDGFDLAEFNPR